VKEIEEILTAARNAALLENEGLDILDLLGIDTPERIFVANAPEASLSYAAHIPGAQVVVKVISPKLLHKTEARGVAIVPNDRAHVTGAMEDMTRRLSDYQIAGFTINQYVRHDAALGTELLLGMRWTDGFGAVVTLGAGGIHTEFLAASFKSENSVAILTPAMCDCDIAEAIRKTAIARLTLEPMRGQSPPVKLEQLLSVIRRFFALAEYTPDLIREFEINPLIAAESGLFAVDALVKLGPGRQADAAGKPALSRPVHKIRHLLEPRSIAVMGVSEKLNPGHVIVNNLIREGFPRDRIFIIKPNSRTIEGCRCVESIAALPERVDLLVLSISAAQTPEAVDEIIEHQKAESIVVIPGGFDEKSGAGGLAIELRRALARSRETAWQGPVINGGNCLGIRSLPGRFDTMFIPECKLPLPRSVASPLALISQSGAFAIAAMSKLTRLNPKYVITVGNQLDLTIGDYLSYLKNDSDLRVFAVYLEGFKAGDGRHFLQAVREITATGRPVICYAAGRTPAGRTATTSHTASIAGDFAITRQLAASAGALVTEDLAEFEDLVRLFAMLDKTKVAGKRLAAVSNAGFECVAIADNIADNPGDFRLATFSADTVEEVGRILCRARIDQLVDVHNPLDLTPMADDAVYEAVVRTVMKDPGVDAGIIGIVPLTPGLNTLAPSFGEDSTNTEDTWRDDSVAMRLAGLKREIDKPWVAIIDSGPLYDAMAQVLEMNQVPVFQTADRACRLLNLFCRVTGRREQS
jgi:acyl-CoA synthetase (NDP forming)